METTIIVHLGHHGDTIQVENISGDSMVVTQSIQGATFLPGGGNLTLNLRAQIPGVHDHHAPSA